MGFELIFIWGIIIGVVIDVVYIGVFIVVGDRVIFVDVGGVIFVGEVWVIVIDVVFLDIGIVVGVVEVIRERIVGIFIYIFCIVLILLFYKGMNIGWRVFKNNEFLISRNCKVVLLKCAFKILFKYRKKIYFYIINDDNVILLIVLFNFMV